MLSTMLEAGHKNKDVGSKLLEVRNAKNEAGYQILDVTRRL